MGQFNGLKEGDWWSDGRRNPRT